jgi:hypothetical protein
MCLVYVLLVISCCAVCMHVPGVCSVGYIVLCCLYARAWCMFCSMLVISFVLCAGTCLVYVLLAYWFIVLCFV